MDLTTRLKTSLADNTGDPVHILILKVGARGDVIRTSYMLEDLYCKYDYNITITWIVGEDSFDLLRFNPYIHTLHSLSTFQQLVYRTADDGITYDHIVSLDDERAVCALPMQVKHRRLTGAYDRDNQVFYTSDSARWFDMGLVSKHGKAVADLLKKQNTLSHSAILGEMLGIQIKRPMFFGSPILQAQAETYLRRFARPLIGLNLSAGPRWPSKRLQIVEAISLARQLLDRGYTCLLLGGTQELLYNQHIQSAVAHPRCLLVSPLSLLQFAAMISQLDAVFCSDSLALHLAISQNVPNVSYYTATSAAEIDTFGTGKKIVSTAGDYCSYAHDAGTSTITAERLLAAFSELELHNR